MRSLLATLTFDIDRLEQAARAGATWATDLAEILVARGLPFRDAHERRRRTGPFARGDRVVVTGRSGTRGAASDGDGRRPVGTRPTARAWRPDRGRADPLPTRVNEQLAQAKACGRQVPSGLILDSRYRVADADRSRR